MATTRKRLLVTPSTVLAAAVAREVPRQAASLSRQAILADSVANIRLLVVDTLATAFGVANDYAPEHLHAADPRAAAAGSPTCKRQARCFSATGRPSPMGDYCSGPNHTLPTYGHASAYSGLSLEDFQKRISVQELTPAGLRGLERDRTGPRDSRRSRRACRIRRHPPRCARKRRRDESRAVAGAPGDPGAQALFARRVAAVADAIARQRGCRGARPAIPARRDSTATPSRSPRRSSVAWLRSTGAGESPACDPRQR